MTTNADAISALVNSKFVLQNQCDAADSDTLDKLEEAIHHISSEIGALETTTLNTASYIPQTEAFKNATDKAKAFLTTLNTLKTIFNAIGAVASAIDSVINLISKLSL